MSGRFAALVFACLLAAAAAGAQPAGRLAEASGPVSVSAGSGWAGLARGRAVEVGQSLRTGPRSQAEIEIGPDRIGLDPDTELRLDGLVPGGFAATLTRGRAMLLLRGLQAGQSASLAAPGATVAFLRPGLYVVDTGEGGRPPSVGVTRGLAQVAGPGGGMLVQPGRTGVWGDTLRGAHVREGVVEGFMADDPSAPPVPAIVTPAAPPAGSAPPPGAEILQREGSWEETAEYGEVWYPPVAPGWAPYGSSLTVLPGWGYVPYGAGVWLRFGPRWGWVPPPVYRHHYRGYPPVHRPFQPQYRPPPAYRPQPALPPVLAPRPVPGGPPPGGAFRPVAPPVHAPPPAYAPPPRPAMPPVMAPRPMAPPAYAPPPRPAPPRPAPSGRTCGPLRLPC